MNMSDCFDQIDELIRTNRKVEAIKEYRRITFSGLKESFNAIEKRSRELGCEDVEFLTYDPISERIILDGYHGRRYISLAEAYRCGRPCGNSNELSI